MINTEEIETLAKSTSVLKGGHPHHLILVSDPDRTDWGYRFSKRLIDLVASTLLLLVLFPLFLVISFLIVAKDGAPVLFKHRRVGFQGKEFLVLKFRTMRRDAEKILTENPKLMAEFTKSYKLNDDPRITLLGKWLRAYSLDELPQLINVFRGEMSLVGPRPVVREELQKYGEDATAYLALKPGCAGLWQCSGRSDTSYAERVRLDVDYGKNASCWYDFKVFFSTILAVIRRRGAR